MQASYDKFQTLNAEVIAVFREEQEGAAGLAKTRANTKVTFPLLLDLDAKETTAYSKNAFTTYLIDPQGIVRGVFSGTKTDRAKTADVLKQLQQLQAE